MIKIYADTETYKIGLDKEETSQISKPYVIGLYVNNTFLYFTKAQQFADYLFSQKDDITLYFFNATYDIDKIILWLHTETYYYYSFYNLKYNDDKQFLFGSFTIYKNKNVFKKIEIRDLWLFNRAMSIEKYYNLFYPNKEQQKGTIDYDKWNVSIYKNTIHYINSQKELKTVDLQTELDYLEKDVKIMPKIDKYISNFKDKALKLLDVKEPKKWQSIKEKTLTLPSLMKFLTNLHMKEKQFFDAGFNIFRKVIKDEYFKTIMVNSYVGGFNFINKNYSDIREKVYKIDINSLYPSIEANHRLPHSEILKEQPKDNYYTTWYIIKTSGFTYNEQHNWIDIKPLPERLFNVHTIINKNYFDYVQKHFGSFDNLEILDTFYQQTTATMNPIIKQLYSLKVNAETKEVRNTAKLLYNSGYGKKGEKPHTKEYKWEYEKHRDNFFLNKLIEEDGTYSMLTGIYITQMSRIELFKGIEAVLNKGGTVYYGDTDSILTNLNPLETDLEIHPTKLGAWAIESSIDGKITPYDGLILLPNVHKKYYTYYLGENEKYSKIVFSGVPLKYVNNLSHNDKMKLFNKDNNVLFKEVKTASYNNIYGQTLLKNIDVQSNNKNTITHILINGVLKEYEKC